MRMLEDEPETHRLEESFAGRRLSRAFSLFWYKDLFFCSLFSTLSIFLLMYYEAEKGWPRRTVLMDPRCKSLRDTHKQMTCMQEA